jgi:hypothetical protein
VSFDQTYLNFQEIITPDALVVHLMVGIIRVTAAFIFDKGEA